MTDRAGFQIVRRPLGEGLGARRIGELQTRLPDKRAFVADAIGAGDAALFRDLLDLAHGAPGGQRIALGISSDEYSTGGKGAAQVRTGRSEGGGGEAAARDQRQSGGVEQS